MTLVLPLAVVLVEMGLERAAPERAPFPLDSMLSFLRMPIGFGLRADVRSMKAGSHQESHQPGRRVSASGMTETSQLSGDIPQRGLHVNPKQGGSR